MNFLDIKVKNEYTYVWLRYDFPDIITIGKDRVQSLIRYMQVDCAIDKYKSLSATAVKENGDKRRDKVLEKWEYAMPGTQVFKEVRNACAYISSGRDYNGIVEFYPKVRR